MSESEKKKRELLKAIENLNTMERMNFSLSAIGTAQKKLNEIRSEVNRIDFPIMSRALFTKGI